ncbi:HdeD family acid-resistance protein [Rhizobium sp. BK602]|uniref:HdeD family acid-resistance protein n=1 Tax=Rhizobium sp. BK602 TaxID=2586986 RepID=UPI00161BA180|nr:HdeD family acid-resistance protein [Rhizobium sp. BK602]MBB3612737.1 uncharacterized membrane protein HdeD (DUF308 family) [Rhizobium sp. BK602]
MTSITEVAAERDAFANARGKWGWFLLLGVAFIALGAIAAGNLFYATIAAVFYVGVLMTAAGALQILHAFRLRTWGGFFLWLLSGLLYAIAGAAAFTNPALASAILTLLLALLTLASGMFRLLIGFRAKPTKGWGWIIASGVVTAVAGLILIVGWPVNSIWLLGLLLAIDLMFQGMTLIGFACQLGTIP